MRFGMNLPDHRTIGNAQSIDNPVGIAEERGLSSVADGNRSFDSGGSLEHPPQAAGRSIQRVDGAIFAAYE